MAQLADALVNLNENEVTTLVQMKIDAGADPMSIVNELRTGMDIIGMRYKNGDFFLGELIAASEIFKEAMEKKR